MRKDTILETTLGKRNGEPHTLQAVWGDLPEVAQDRIIRYGFQRIFNDRVGGSDKTLDDKVAQATEMLEAFKRGEVTAARTSSGDPVLDEMRKMALRAWIAAKDSDARKAKHKAWTDDEREAAADKLIASQSDDWQAELRTKAEAELARRKAEREAKRKAADKVRDAMGDIDL